MILSEDEAICLILVLSEGNNVNSQTKLNKLIARLNLHLIPVEIDFELNKYGSFSADLEDLTTNDYYEVYSYPFRGRTCQGYRLKDKGRELFNTVVNRKINSIMDDPDKVALKDEIFELSTRTAEEISGNEHRKLLVDVDERHKLIGRVNEVLVDMSDTYRRINEVPEDTSEGIKLRALIEYCYYLAKFIHNKFQRLPEDEYDFEAFMFDYYFLYHLHEINGFLNKQIDSPEKDTKKINKYYDYLVRSIKERYPFSLNNKDLKDILVR